MKKKSILKYAGVLLIVLFMILSTVVLGYTSRDTFMGLEVTPLGDALLDIDEEMRVYNLDDDGGDGVQVNLEGYSAYECIIDVDSPTEHGTASVAYGMIGEEPFGMGVMLEREGCGDKKTYVHVDQPYLGEESPAIIAIGPDDDIVFYTTVDKLGYIGYVVEQTKGVYPVSIDFTSETGGNGVTCSLFWFDIEGVSYTWEEHHVYGVVINELVIVGELEGTGNIVFTHFIMLTTGLDEFTIQEHYAYEQLDPPAEPTIDGPSSGNPGTAYTYQLDNIGIEDVYIFIDWGDGSVIEYTELITPGGVATVSHTWLSQGKYTIKARAMNEWGTMSDWAELEVTMPRDKATNNILLQRLLERFPLLQKLIQQQWFRL